MITLAELNEVVELQNTRLNSVATIVPREIIPGFSHTASFALILSGIRRCGKSTVLTILVQAEKDDSFYINFDTPKLYHFEINDFAILDLIIRESKKKKLYFDEIQIVKGWEMFVREKLDEGYHVVVSGSNATLLSIELGTRLTGRQITKELFPFSYREFLEWGKAATGEETFLDYVSKGGFPEYLKTGNSEIHANLLEDIIYRDIAVRFQIRDVRTVKNVMQYLISNVGTLVSATRLKQVFSIKSTATLLEYFSYAEQSYLMFYVPKFSYSLKSQSVNPKKIYCIDTGLINSVSSSFSKNIGHIFENAVFLELRRSFREIYYFSEQNSECDFVIFNKNNCIGVYQVCFEITHDNKLREFNGAAKAAAYFGLTGAVIITVNQDDLAIVEGIQVKVIPAFRLFSQKINLENIN